ncbi:MAG: VTT domain-containing protein [Methanomicrobiales archaeon]|nr:VTT domain-containing protein [Methanomicrobiales archaeon]
MDPISVALDLLLHFDTYLPQIIELYGFWTYVFLFFIIFLETGLVIMPYLPGDSLLFVAGALAGARLLNVWLLIGALILAAVFGNIVNYWLGITLGMKVLEKQHSLVKKEHLETTRAYFQKYGGSTIVIARFVPFIRSFAPFLAGVGKMQYPRFLMYNVLGGGIWVIGFVLVGYFFGNLSIVQENFGLIIYAIIGLSLLAVAFIVINIIRTRRRLIRGHLIRW